MRNDICRTVIQEQRDLETEAGMAAASLIEGLVDELCEAWKVAAEYSDGVAYDGHYDLYYNRSATFDRTTNTWEAITSRPGKEWAERFGGINGRCGTNPEDCPVELMSIAQFWHDYANCNGS